MEDSTDAVTKSFYVGNGTNGRPPDGQTEVTLDSVKDMADHQEEVMGEQPERADVDPGGAEAATCGFTRECCAPAGIQRCAAIAPFTANVSGLFFINVAFFTYFLGTIRTLEKRFDLSSTKSSVALVMMDVVFAFLSLLVGYLGRKSHKPRVIVVCQVLTSVGIFILALPMLIYGPKHSAPTGVAAVGTADSGSAQWASPSLEKMPSETEISRLIGLCVPDDLATGPPGLGHASSGNRTSPATTTTPEVEDALGSVGGDACSESAADGSAESVESEESRKAYILMLCGSLLIGLGGVAVSTLGIPYIDENIAQADSACYIGVATSAYSWAPIVGLLLAALCTRIPEAIQDDRGLRPSHPSYIGAWWLGMVILGTLSLILTAPMALFPKHLHHYYVKKGNRRALANRAAEDNVGNRLSDFPRLTLRFLTNPAYMTLLLSKICGLYGVTGVILQLPRYMEIHYRQPAYIASIIAALSGGIVGALGTVLGGFALRRLKLDTWGIGLMFALAAVFGMLGTAVCMSYSCPQTTLEGNWHPHKQTFSIETPCSTKCGCSTSNYRQPVCTEDQRTFFSQCHAGCQTAVLSNHTFENCTCAGGVKATAGFCEKDECNTLIPYIMTFIIVSFLVSFGRVPATILMFRLVGEKEKAPVMGLTSFFVNILCFVPAPILFGMLFDSACVVWKSSCTNTGACLFYDTRRFRLLMHGVTLCFQLPSAILAGITLYLIRKKKPPHSHDNADTDKSKEALTLSKQSPLLIGYKHQNGQSSK